MRSDLDRRNPEIPELLNQPASHGGFPRLRTCSGDEYQVWNLHFG
jgi:hypothetical protein